jgi:hypothetical protein
MVLAIVMLLLFVDDVYKVWVALEVSAPKRVFHAIIPSTCGSVTVGTVLAAVQYYKIINGSATGIRNR